MPTSTSLRKSSRRWPLADSFPLLALPLLVGACRHKEASTQKERPTGEGENTSALDKSFFCALRLYEEGKLDEASKILENMAERADNYPYAGDVYDLLADCYGALDRPGDEYRCLLRALECYKAGSKTRRYPSTKEAIERIKSYLPLLLKQIRARAGG